MKANTLKRDRNEDRIAIAILARPSRVGRGRQSLPPGSCLDGPAVDACGSLGDVPASIGVATIILFRTGPRGSCPNDRLRTGRQVIVCRPDETGVVGMVYAAPLVRGRLRCEPAASLSRPLPVGLGHCALHHDHRRLAFPLSKDAGISTPRLLRLVSAERAAPVQIAPRDQRDRKADQDAVREELIGDSVERVRQWRVGPAERLHDPVHDDPQQHAIKQPRNDRMIGAGLGCAARPACRRQPCRP